ncbi:Transcriptional regulatory protein QseF [compost metagenome]
MRILLVEDCEDFCRLLRVRLAKKFPAHFVLARCGHEASVFLENSEFDLVVSDYHMDEGNGLWLYEFMQKTFPAIPLIVFTSAPHEVAVNENDILRAVVEKPDFKSLYSRIEEVFQNP